MAADRNLAQSLGVTYGPRFTRQLNRLIQLNDRYIRESGVNINDEEALHQPTNMSRQRNNAFKSLLGHQPTRREWNIFRNYHPYGHDQGNNSNNSTLTIFENLGGTLNRAPGISTLGNGNRSFLNRLRITGAGSNSNSNNGRGRPAFASNSNSNNPTRRRLTYSNNSNNGRGRPAFASNSNSNNNTATLTKKNLINMINDAEKKWKQSMTRQAAQGRTIPYVWRNANYSDKTLKNEVNKKLKTETPSKVHKWLKKQLEMYALTFNYPTIKESSGPEILSSFWGPDSWINPPSKTNINRKARSDLLDFIRFQSAVGRPLSRVDILTLKNEGKNAQQMINLVKDKKKKKKMLVRAHGRYVPTAPTSERYQIVNLNRKSTSKKTIPKNLMKELGKNVKASAYLWNGKPALNMPMFVKKGRGQNYGGLTRNLYSDVRDKLIKNGAIKITQPGKYYFLTNANYAPVLGALSGKVLRGKEPSVSMWPLGLDPSLFVEPYGLSSLSPARIMGLLKAVHPDVWEHLDVLNQDSNKQKVVAILNKQLTRIVNTDPRLKLLLKKLETKSKNFNKMTYGKPNYTKTLAYIKALQKAIASRLKIETNLPPTKKRHLTVNKYKKINKLLTNIKLTKRDIQGNNINKNMFGMSNAAWKKTMGKLDTTNLNQDNKRKLVAQQRIARYFLFEKNMNARMKFYQSLPPNIQIRDPSTGGGGTIEQNRKLANATLNKAIKLSNTLGKIKPLNRK